jgi:hypothetical protein
MPRIIATGSLEASSRKFLMPVMEGLEGLFFLWGSPERCAINYAPGKPDGIVVGEPGIAENYASFQGQSKFVQTQVEETDEATIFTVGRIPGTPGTSAGTSSMLYGTYTSPAAAGGATTFGVSLTNFSDTDGVTALATRGNTVADDTSDGIGIAAGIDWSQFDLFVHSFYAEGGNAANKGSRIRTIKTGQSAGPSSSPLPRFRSNGKLRIGSGYVNYAGLSDIALWAYYSRVLSANEQSKVIEKIQTLMSARGISI